MMPASAGVSRPTPRPAVANCTPTIAATPQTIAASASAVPRARHVEPGEDRHEQADAEQRVEDRQQQSTMLAEAIASATPITALASVVQRATSSTLRVARRRRDEPLVEILRQRRRQHEQHGVGGADLGREHRGQADARRPAAAAPASASIGSASWLSASGAKHAARRRCRAAPGRPRRAAGRARSGRRRGGRRGRRARRSTFCSRPGETMNAGASSAR